MENINNYIQERFLKEIKNDLVKIFLNTGYSFNAKIIASDNFCLLVTPVKDGAIEVKTSLIFKASITAIEVIKDVKINKIFIPEIKSQEKQANTHATTISKPRLENIVNEKNKKDNNTKKTFTNPPKKDDFEKKISIADAVVATKNTPIPTISSNKIKFDSPEEIRDNKREEYSIMQFQKDLSN